MNAIRGFVLTFLVLVGFSPVAGDDDLHVYLGNLHSHTSYSDGSGLPSEAYQAARAAGLDFMAITEHNHSKQIKPKGRDGVPIGTDHTLYNGPAPESLLNAAMHATEDKKFIALYGQEFSTISSGNHANVFEISEVITAESGHFDQLVGWLESHPDSANKPAIVQFNHPSSQLRAKQIEYGADDFGSEKKWIAAMSKHARLIEVLNGPGLSPTVNRKPTEFERDYKYYLNLGFHVGPTGDQDNHYKTWGKLTDARTGLVAPELTRPAILEAMRSRHVYATNDKRLKAIFRITYQGMPAGRPFLLCGDIAEKPAEHTPLKITYTIENEDKPTAEYDIEVLADVIGGEDTATTIVQTTQNGNTKPGHPGEIAGVEYTGGREYFYFRITTLDGSKKRLWTAPIWFESADSAEVDSPVAAVAVDESNCLASKRSKIYHIDATCRDAGSIAPANRLTGKAAMEGRTLHKGCPK